MDQKLSLVLALLLVASASACHSAASRQKRAEQVQQEQAEMRAAIPADSPLAKVDFGMSESQVRTLLGEPTSEESHITGKQFIPFNFAAQDTSRLVYFYKGVGRLEFSFGSWGQRNGVVKIEHDPNEPGQRPAQ